MLKNLNLKVLTQSERNQVETIAQLHYKLVKNLCIKKVNKFKLTLFASIANAISLFLLQKQQKEQTKLSWNGPYLKHLNKSYTNIIQKYAF